MKKIFALMLLFPVVTIAEQSFYDFPAPTSFTATATSTQALPADTFRKTLIIQNNGSQIIYVKFGSAQAATEGIAIHTSGDLLNLQKAPINSIYIRSANGSHPVTLQVGR